MNPEHIYEFDLNGYVVIPRAIAAPHLQRLQTFWTEHLTSRLLHDVDFDWGEEWRALIDLDAVYSFLASVYRSKFRLDHMFCADERFVSSGGNLHHEADMFDEGIYYWVRNQRIHSGLMAVQYAVSDVTATENHFCCIPGSHRANFPVPDRFRDASNNTLLRHVFLNAGDALVFSEALVHGTYQVTNSRTRRSVFARYMNNHSYFRKPLAHHAIVSLPPTPNHAECDAPIFTSNAMTPRQRQLATEPAYARGHGPVRG
ncbi:phytanoyl-CoA dioxygenase family protein [Pandoraea sp. PE-S2R-1]|uniref:phytanoyl-CoA dioxygenase family protein n=1 Tax=Pandoraea sp. PE-S2R-1 TaxID=1986994 RepID=UPI000B3FFD05|nr:phytanoyl-CoA dioxygenase family protein [Pandoraea sp. PE-S2R-1]